MPELYQHRDSVKESDIDGQGHANNIAYFHWLQDAAVAHSAAQGWPTARYKEKGWSWVVRSHYIEYRRPLLVNDLFRVETWVADMKKYSSLRKYEIIHEKSGKLMVRAETNWAFIDLDSGRLIAVPEEVTNSFIASEKKPAS